MKFKIKKRLLVDMTASILHHGHIRLLKKAKKLGNVEIIVALTTDNEVKKHKGYYPDLKFRFRKEILESIRYVDEIKPSKWQIDDEYLALSNFGRQRIIRGIASIKLRLHSTGPFFCVTNF